jgi:hypothetical protein
VFVNVRQIFYVLKGGITDEGNAIARNGKLSEARDSVSAWMILRTLCLRNTFVLMLLHNAKHTYFNVY